MAGLNEYSARYITKILNTRKFVYIKEFVQNLGLAGGDNKMEYLDSFIHLFFDLNGQDAFEYRVSYFT